LGWVSPKSAESTGIMDSANKWPLKRDADWSEVSRREIFVAEITCTIICYFSYEVFLVLEAFHLLFNLFILSLHVHIASFSFLALLLCPDHFS